MSRDAAPQLADATWLASPEGAAALALAQQVWDHAGSDPLRAGARLRDDGVAQAPLLLEQIALRQEAHRRYGIDASGLLLTRDGLEAATRPDMAAHRARLIAASGARHVVDLTAGLGFDTAAFLAVGLHVTAVERHPAIAAMLGHNHPGARVVTGDATDAIVRAEVLAHLDDSDVVFVDPARRDPAGPRETMSGRARPERDPERWSPPWSFVEALAHPRVAAKVSPGFSPPPHWQAQWSSIDRTVVECGVYSWDALRAKRTAAIVGGGSVAVIAADPDAPHPTSDDVGAWIHEVDPAVLRARALPALCRDSGLSMLDGSSSWLTGPQAVTHPALRAHRVITILTGSSREQRSQLRHLGVSRATIKGRDVGDDPRQVLRELALREGLEHVIVRTLHQGRRISLLVEPYLGSRPGLG